MGSLAIRQWTFKRQPGTQVALKYLGLEPLLFLTPIVFMNEGLCYEMYLASFSQKRSNHQKAKIVYGQGQT